MGEVFSDSLLESSIALNLLIERAEELVDGENFLREASLSKLNEPLRFLFDEHFELAQLRLLDLLLPCLDLETITDVVVVVLYLLFE